MLPGTNVGQDPQVSPTRLPKEGGSPSIAVHGSWGLIGPKQQFLTGGDLVTSSCGIYQRPEMLLNTLQSGDNSHSEECFTHNVKGPRVRTSAVGAEN